MPATETPGIENGTLTNATALVEAHVSALAAVGFETDQRVNGSQSVRGEVLPTARRVRTLSQPGASEYRYRFINRKAGSRFDFWGNRSVQVVRTYYGGEARSVSVLNQTANVSELARGGVLETYLSASTFTVRSREVHNGTTLVTLTANGTHAPDAVSPRNATDVRNYTATVVVDTTGRIYSLDVSAEYTHDGEEYELSVRYRLTRIGVEEGDVTRPDWARRALEGQ